MTRPSPGAAPDGDALGAPGGRRTSGSQGELRIVLACEEELFEAPSAARFVRGGDRLRCGMDEMLAELGARRLGTVPRATIVLPARELSADSQPRLRAAVDRYCALRLHEADNELQATLRDALRALVVGLIVLAAGLALSVVVLDSSAPHAIRTLLGDGLFLVIAWVGAWYPFDVLIHYMRPQRRARRVLLAAAELELVVASGETEPPPRDGTLH